MNGLQDENQLRSKGFVMNSAGEWEKKKTLPMTTETPKSVYTPVDRERKLHEEIINWCESQFPKVTYIHSRIDVPSTIDRDGVADFILCFPNQRTVFVEAKAKGGKLSDAQNIFKHEVEAKGYQHITTWSFEEFLILINPKK